jgi:WD40 repeat protein
MPADDARVADDDLTVTIPPPPPPPPNDADAECPYPGLEPFDGRYVQWFFGRERVGADLLRRLAARLAGAGPLVVVGVSGAGKSSLLRAGLLPALAAGALGVPGSADWPRLVLTPTDHPVAELAARIAGLAATPALTAPDLERIIAETVTEPERFATTLTDIVTSGSRGPDPRLVLVVDQFEETFTMCEDPDERLAFIQALCAATQAAGDGRPPPAAVVLGVRADFYSACAGYPRLVGSLQDGQVVLGPMSTAETRDAIVRPAQAAGLELEPGLADLLLRDLGAADRPDGTATDPGSLPLLSHALRATWQQRAGHLLTIEGYRRIGGIAGSVATTAEDTFAALSTAGQEAARRLLPRLVRIGDGTADTRRRVDPAVALRGLADPVAAAAALDALTAARLVTVDEHSVEITHEALIRSWPRLRIWIDTDRAGHLTRQQIEEAAETWDVGNREQSFLYTGTRLATARDWVGEADHRRDLPPTAAAFLDASIARQDAEGTAERRRTRRLRRLVAALSVLLALTAAAAVFVAHQRSVIASQRTAATSQRDRALSQRIAGIAGQISGSQPLLGSQLALAAWRRAQTPEARGALLDAFSHGSGTRILAAHKGSIGTIAYSPDGRLLATGSDDWTAKLWDVSTPGRPRALATLRGHVLAVKSVAFSADGRTLATGSDDRTVRLWDISDPRHPTLRSVLPARFTASVFALAFSPTAPVLATGSLGTTVRLWDVTDPARPTVLGSLAGHTGTVTAVEFSPDGRRLASGSADTTTRLWDVADARHPRPLAVLLTDQTGAVGAVAFSPDGSTLASSSSGRGTSTGGTRTWNISDPAHPVHTHTFGTVTAKGIAFTRDGRVLVTADFRKSVYLWSLGPDASPAERDVPSTTFGSGAATWDVVVSPNGRDIAVADNAGTVTIWDYPSNILYGPTVLSAITRFAPDGHTVAIASNDDVLRLFDLSRPDRPVALGSLPAPGPVGDLAFDHTGHLLAVVDVDGFVRLWDVTDPRRPVPRGSVPSATTVAFTPDGRTMVTNDFNGTYQLWDVTDPRRPVRLATPAGSNGLNMIRLRVSPDGRVLAGAGIDRTVHLWEISDRRAPKPLAVIGGFVGGVYDVAFNPGGGMLATADDDGTAQLWDIHDPGHPHRLAVVAGHVSRVSAVRFTPDGRILATSSLDGTVRLWDVTNPRRPAPYAALPGQTSDSRQVYDADLGGDGQTLVAATTDEVGDVWDLDPAQAARRVCATAGSSPSSRITPAEWAQYLPDLPYAPPCA